MEILGLYHIGQHILLSITTVGDLEGSCYAQSLLRVVRHTPLNCGVKGQVCSVTSASVALNPGQTHPSMGQVGMGQNVNGLTDPSVELVEQCCTDPSHLGFCHHGQNSQ
jgi:hypothetical protein